MKHQIAMFVVLALFGCGELIPDPNPPPQPLPPPEDPEATCDTACDNLAELREDGCGVPPERCMADCKKTENVEAKQGVRFPVSCMTAAQNCKDAWACK